MKTHVSGQQQWQWLWWLGAAPATLSVVSCTLMVCNVLTMYCIADAALWVAWRYETTRRCRAPAQHCAEVQKRLLLTA